jgi:hypothetical protein
MLIPGSQYVVVLQVIVLCWSSVIGYIVLSGTMAHNVCPFYLHPSSGV